MREILRVPKRTATTKMISFRPSSLKCLFLLVTILCLVIPGFRSSKSQSSSLLFADAYRVGDTIDAAFTTRSSLAIDMLIANQPLFGVTKTIRMARLPERFSISFEDGLYTIPYVDASSTEKLVVTFVYSKSGTGRIHSVTSMAIQSSKRRKIDRSKEMEIVFDWVEEAEVDLEAGSIVMFLAVFIVSIMFLLQLCTIEQPDDVDGHNDGRNDSYYKGR